MSNYKTAIYIEDFISFLDLEDSIHYYDMCNSSYPDYIVMRSSTYKKMEEYSKKFITYSQEIINDGKEDSFNGIPILVTHD